MHQSNNTTVAGAQLTAWESDPDKKRERECAIECYAGLIHLQLVATQALIDSEFHNKQSQV